METERILIPAENSVIREKYAVEEYVTGRPARIKPPFRLWRKVRKLWGK